MRLVFLAVDDEYAGAMQRPLYEQHPDWIVGSVLSGCRVYKKSDPEALLFLIRRSGIDYVASMARAKLLPNHIASGGVTPSILANQHGVPTLVTRDINSPSSRGWLERIMADVAVSTNFSHILAPAVAGIPRVGTWNLHKSRLPQYRGMAPSFYALLEGASEVGVTLHRIDDGVDTGPIFCQETMSISPSDTVHSLNLALSRRGGRLMTDFLEHHPALSVEPTPQPAGEWPTHSYPTREMVRRFRALGKAFV